MFAVKRLWGAGGCLVALMPALLLLAPSDAMARRGHHGHGGHHFRGHARFSAPRVVVAPRGYGHGYYPAGYHRPYYYPVGYHHPYSYPAAYHYPYPAYGYCGSPVYTYARPAVSFRFVLTNTPPAGYYYRDPYCDLGFGALDLYVDHFVDVDHPRVIQVVDERSDGVRAFRYARGRWVAAS